MPETSLASSFSSAGQGISLPGRKTCLAWPRNSRSSCDGDGDGNGDGDGDCDGDGDGEGDGDGDGV